MRVHPDKPAHDIAPSDKAKAASSQPMPGDPPSRLPTSGDRLDLSPRAKEVSRAAEVLARTPDTRDAKVQELRQAVENGTYAVTPAQIAEKMIQETLPEIVP